MIRACIFDLGGTIVDKYSLTPFLSFKNAFKKNNINIRNSLIKNDMGMDKKSHIEKILNDPYTARNWFVEHKKYPNNDTVEKIYKDFNEIQNNQAKSIDIIPETKKCINYLRGKNILLGCTTGFGKETMENIGTVLRKDDIYLDSYVSSTCVDISTVRPKAGMIYKNMLKLDLLGKSDKIIKLDDTKIGIQEGNTAGCITVGVARWSTYMDFEPDADEFLNDTDMQRKLIQSRRKLSEANPDYIIDTLDHLIPLINRINQLKF
jgi:phosphonoacetaldehyde hydrolase